MIECDCSRACHELTATLRVLYAPHTQHIDQHMETIHEEVPEERALQERESSCSRAGEEEYAHLSHCFLLQMSS